MSPTPRAYNLWWTNNLATSNQRPHPLPELDFLMENFDILSGVQIWLPQITPPLNQNFSWGSCALCTVSFITLYIVMTFLHCNSLLSITLILKRKGIRRTEYELLLSISDEDETFSNET